VARDRKLAAPAAPNRLPAEPPPNAAPISEPLPCCSNTSTMMVSAEITCTTSTPVRIKDISCSRSTGRTGPIAGPVRPGHYLSCWLPVGPDGSRGLRDAREFGRVERRPAHQAAIDIGHGEQAGGVGGLDAAAVQ